MNMQTRRKPESPQRDRFAEWDQELLRDDWNGLCRDEGHRAAAPKSIAGMQANGAKGAAARRQYSKMMVTLLSNLRYSDVKRAALRIRLGKSCNYNAQLRRAKEMGWITGDPEPDAMIHLTMAGRIALAAMRKEPQ